MKQVLSHHIKFFFPFLFGVCILLPQTIIAQDTNNEQVKRLQRAIFIFNFAEQVTWANQDEILQYKIGVLGQDRTYIDLKSLSQRRKIKNKPVNILSFNSVREVKDVNILYVNKAFSFDLEYILTKIANKNILLVSEDYNFNSSMINMVSVGDSYEYEINERLLEREKFMLASSLKKYAVSSSDKWKKLYKNSEVSLKESKAAEAKKQAALNKKNEELDSKKEELDAKNQALQNQKDIISSQTDSINVISATAKQREKWLKLLSSESDLQKQKLENKVALERKLEENILEQLAIVKSQEEKITASEQKLKQQTDSIINQKKEIKENAAILEEKNDKISSQRKFNYLLLGLVSLSLLAALFIYRNFKAKKKLAQTLNEKNIAIIDQSIELEAKNNELEQFAYIASHDLKEPLVTISSLIDLLVEDYGDKFDDEGKMSLGFVKDSSVRMRKLIDAILAYSRLGKSKAYVNVDCNAIIETLKGDLQNIIERTNSKIVIDRLPVVKGAELEIRLLFQNLISNGIKFTKPDVDPIVSISAKKTVIEESNYWQFAVKDNGIGIDKKYQERIFAIFQRLHSRDDYEGTGIGLAHCKKIVESHGGKIWLTSEENKGSTFYFTIPVS